MRPLLIVIIAASAGLAGCQDRDRPHAGLCKAFPEAAAQPTAGDGAAVLEDCLHRWAYTLAGGPDDAGTVADATLAACSVPLTRWNQQALSGAEGSRPAQEGQSLLTGETTNPIAEHRNFASDRALFYVAQARAGGCGPPPRRQGAPLMTSPDK